MCCACRHRVPFALCFPWTTSVVILILSLSGHCNEKTGLADSNSCHTESNRKPQRAIASCNETLFNAPESRFCGRTQLWAQKWPYFWPLANISANRYKTADCSPTILFSDGNPSCHFSRLGRTASPLSPNGLAIEALSRHDKARIASPFGLNGIAFGLFVGRFRFARTLA